MSDAGDGGGDGDDGDDGHHGSDGSGGHEGSDAHEGDEGRNRIAAAGADVDPVTLEVVRNAAAATCAEMNATLVRTSHSPNIKERKDCSCALFDSAGEMVAQAENIPVHLGAMPFSVAAAIDAFPPETLAPGDAILLNDPFRGGAHLPDLTLVTPVFATDAGEDLLALAANRAHHADVGGARAGSVAADSTEIYQEGVRIPPVKLRDGGEPNAAVEDLLFANVRTPDERRGDLRAQVAANETAVGRVRELRDEHGRATLDAAFAAVQDYGERRMRGEIDALPDGRYRFADVLDDDGRGTEDLPVVATVVVDGDAVTVDFEGTAPQTEGPVNAVFAVTASATYYAVRCVTDPDIPPSAGAYRPIEVRAPEGTIVNPAPPAAVVGGNLETSQRVTDAVLGAFAAAVPERAVAAGQGTMNNVTFGGTDPRRDGTDDATAGATGTDGSAGEPFAFYETQAGGYGGRAGADGMDAVHVHMSNTLNTPAEVLETAYPLRVREYALRPDSGGAGEFRGGLGLRRAIEVRAACTCSLLADRQRHAPYGIAGGADGARGETWIDRRRDGADEWAREDGDARGHGAGDGERVPGKSTHELSAGTIVTMVTPGGGGYGDPADRDAAAIRRDLRLGTLSPAAARERYGYDPAGE